MKKIIALSLLPLLSCQANMNPKIGFKPFPNYYFVETGSFGGDGIAFALDAKHYTEILSLEIYKPFVDGCRERFRDQKIEKILEINPLYTISYIAGGNDSEYNETTQIF